jgi:transcriptional regulator with XRE-family HTH domain
MKNEDSITNSAKQIFAENFKRLMEGSGKTQADMVIDLGITASTVSDWYLGKKYPRVDKMQTIAEYFGVRMSDLTEKKETHPLFSERVMKMAESNNDFRESIELLSQVDPSMYESIKQIAKGIIAKRGD